jgi:hypothetical protein
LWVFALVLAACGAESEVDAPETLGQAAQPWFSGYGPTRGHEDITRFGIGFANELIATELQIANYFPPVDKGDACLTTSHALLRGNCITDWPDDEMVNFYGVSSTDFGTHPDLQDLHYMRNFHAGTEAYSGRYACHGARERIIAATERGMEFWAQGNETAGYRWFGHATHNLQDSFATCHTSRTGALHETLTDLCTYKIEVPGVCYHQNADLRDRIWDVTGECAISTERLWDCLVSEARSAAYATAGYLLLVARHIEAGMTGNLRASLMAYFEQDPTNPHAGYYRCDGLKDDGYEPPGWTPDPPDAGVEAGPDAPEDASQDAVEETTEQDVGGDEGELPDVVPVPDAGEGGSGGGSVDAGSSGAAGAAVSPAPEEDGGCSCRAAPTASGRLAGVLVGLMALFGVCVRRPYRPTERSNHRIPTHRTKSATAPRT